MIKKFRQTESIIFSIGISIISLISIFGSLQLFLLSEKSFSFLNIVFLVICFYIGAVGLFYSFYKMREYMRGGYVICQQKNILSRFEINAWAFRANEIIIPLSIVRDVRISTNNKGDFILVNRNFDNRTSFYSREKTFSVEVLANSEWYFFNFSNAVQAKNFAQLVKDLSR